MMLTEKSRIDKAVKLPESSSQTNRNDYPYKWINLPRHQYKYNLNYMLFSDTSIEPTELKIERNVISSFIFINNPEEIAKMKEEYLTEFEEIVTEMTYFQDEQTLFFPEVSIDDLTGILECRKENSEVYRMRLIDEKQKMIYNLGLISYKIISDLILSLDEIHKAFMEYASNDFDEFSQYQSILMQKYHFDERTKEVFKGLNDEYEILEKELCEIEGLDEGISKGFITEEQAKEEYEDFMKQWNIDAIIEKIAKDSGKTKEELLEIAETNSVIQSRTEQLLDAEITSNSSVDIEEDPAEE